MFGFEILASLFALTLLEIVLGIDNLVFLSILTNKLHKSERARARRFGLLFAWMTRLIFLFTAIWITKLTHPLLTVFSHPLSLRDVFLFLGGVFLMLKATSEIHREMDVRPKGKKYAPIKNVTFGLVVFQVGIMDIVFSFDSVLTAIGLTDRFWLMSIAITISIFIMIYASDWVERCLDKYPTIKMLALSFLILIGMTLVAEACAFHIPRGYIYFAMVFSLVVEMLNIGRGRHNVDD